MPRLGACPLLSRVACRGKLQKGGARVSVMQRLFTSLFARETLMERGTQHPFTLMLLLTTAIAQATIYVAEFSNIPLSHMVAFDAQSVHIPSLFFPITHYVPLVDERGVGVGFSPVDFAASLVLWLLCGVALLSAGPLVESYLGTRKMLLSFVLCGAGHGLLALTVQPGMAFSSLAFAAFLLVVSTLIHLERRDPAREPESDFRLMLLLLVFSYAAVTAAFLPAPAYDGLLLAAAVGPALGLGVFVFNRRMQMREVEKRGQGHVGALYFVDEFDLMTREEIQSRMDRLLAKISQDGMNSLAPEERRFLANASGRLKASEPRQPAP